MENETKHTPGPWIQYEGRHSDNDQDRRCFWVINQARDGRTDYFMPRICDLYEPDGIDGFMEGEANAKLVAAAPDLLKALEEFLYVMTPLEGANGITTPFKNAREAIAKAKGLSEKD